MSKTQQSMDWKILRYRMLILWKKILCFWIISGILFFILDDKFFHFSAKVGMGVMYTWFIGLLILLLDPLIYVFYLIYRLAVNLYGKVPVRWALALATPIVIIISSSQANAALYAIFHFDPQSLNYTYLLIAGFYSVINWIGIVALGLIVFSYTYILYKQLLSCITFVIQTLRNWKTQKMTLRHLWSSNKLKKERKSVKEINWHMLSGAVILSMLLFFVLTNYDISNVINYRQYIYRFALYYDYQPTAYIWYYCREAIGYKKFLPLRGDYISLYKPQGGMIKIMDFKTVKCQIP